jgi:hypothetical protein
VLIIVIEKNMIKCGLFFLFFVLHIDFPLYIKQNSNSILSFYHIFFMFNYFYNVLIIVINIIKCIIIVIIITLLMSLKNNLKLI